MHGKKQSKALKFISDHTRKRQEVDPQPVPDVQANSDAPNTLSDDNQALFALLARYITTNVAENIETHMQSLNSKIDSLHLNLVQSRLHATPKDLHALRTPTPSFPSAPGQTMGNFHESAGDREAASSPPHGVDQQQWEVCDAAEAHGTLPHVTVRQELESQSRDGVRESGRSSDSSEKRLETAEATDMGNGSAVPFPNPESSSPLNPNSVTPVLSDDAPRGMIRSSSQLLARLEDAEGEAAEAKEQVKIDRLKEALEKMENFQVAASKTTALRESVSTFRQDMTIQKKDTILDVCMAVVILMNSVVIGISMDYDDPAIDIIDLCFTVCFIVELLCKFYLHGFFQHFSHCSNIFDFMIVFVDIVQLLLDLANVDLLSDAPAASIFRVARLVRLVRLIRLARLQMLDDLVALISGMVGGVTTLLWSIVLFFLILYITSLLFREFFGQSSYIIPGSDQDMRLYFNSVPRCMLTVFRFFFGDFTTISGMNIFEGIQEKYGALAATVVCCFFFVISIGLFNVIAAIFVESTLAAANHAQIVRKTERMNDEILWASRLTTLVRTIFEYNGNSPPARMSEALEEFADQAIPEAVFQRYMKDPRVVTALNQLEIDEADHKYLFDILDNDNTGSIIISQLSDGLERLRGDPRRSDIICVDLMVRSIQQQTDFLVQAAKANVKSSTGNRKKMEENQACLYRIEKMLAKFCAERVYDI